MHKKKHLGLTPTFSCDICNLTFGRVYELRRHNATQHSADVGEDGDTRRFTCSECGTKFNRLDALKRHERRSKESVPCRVRLGIKGEPGEPVAGQAAAPSKRKAESVANSRRRSSASQSSFSASPPQYEVSPTTMAAKDTTMSSPVIAEQFTAAMPDYQSGLPLQVPPCDEHPPLQGLLPPLTNGHMNGVLPPIDQALPSSHGRPFGAPYSNGSPHPGPYPYFGSHLAPDSHYYQTGSPVYDFTAPSPGAAHTPYGQGPDYTAWKLDRAGIMFGPGTPVPASPLDLLAMVSPEPSSIVPPPGISNGHGAETAETPGGPGQTSTPGPAAPPPKKDVFLAPAPDHSAELIQSVPYPVLVQALFPARPTPAPVRPLAALYPTLPPSLLPPWPITSYLISQCIEYDHVRVAVLHPPTFYDEVATGRADPNTLLSVMWSGARMADPDVGRQKARACRDSNWEHIFASDGAWMIELREECLRRAFAEWEALKQLPTLDLDTKNPDPDLLSRLTNFAVFAFISRVCCTILGASDVVARLTKIMVQVFPLLKFGELPIDLAPPDPSDLPSFVNRDLRVRRCIIFHLGDMTDADSHGRQPSLVPDPAAITTEANGRYKIGWANMRLSMGPGILFDALPSTSTTPEVWAGILETTATIPLPNKPYKKLTLSVLPLLTDFYAPTLGEIYTRYSLPINDPRRKFISQTLGRGILRNSYIWMQMVLTDIWARFVRVKIYFRSRGWRLHAPPLGDSREERDGRRMRDELLNGIGEFFAELHPEIALLVEKADGRGLRMLCEREWGRTWRSCLPNGLVYIFTFQLILNSPSDIFDKILVDESWPYSNEFVQAEALAMTVSKIVRSSLAVDPETDGSPEDDTVEQERRYRMKRQDEVKRLSPVWGLVALRACWVHVLAIRKFKVLLHSRNADTELITAALATVRGLIDDVDGVLEGWF